MSGLTPFCDARILRSAASRAASSSSTDAPLPMPICTPNAFNLPFLLSHGPLEGSFDAVGPGCVPQKIVAWGDLQPIVAPTGG